MLRLSRRFLMRTPLIQQSRLGFCSKQSELLEEVEQLILKKVGEMPQVNHQLLKREATFQEIGLDSLSQVEAIVALEEIFGLNITDEEAEKINTIKDAITIFHLNLHNKQSSTAAVEQNK